MQSMSYNTTNHLDTRLQQRGIKSEVVNFVLCEADQVSNCRGGSTSLFISKKKLGSQRVRQEYPAQLLEKAEGVVLVESEDTLITAFHKKRRLRLN